jgi:hypothetical protein
LLRLIQYFHFSTGARNSAGAKLSSDSWDPSSVAAAAAAAAAAALSLRVLLFLDTRVCRRLKSSSEAT